MNEETRPQINETEHNPLMDYESAEEIVEQERPQMLKDMDARHPESRSRFKEAVFATVSIRLLDEGVTLPVSRAHADNGEALNPRVMKTLEEWKQYIHSASLDLLGYLKQGK